MKKLSKYHFRTQQKVRALLSVWVIPVQTLFTTHQQARDTCAHVTWERDFKHVA
jgi:hypothetical protein